MKINEITLAEISMSPSSLEAFAKSPAAEGFMVGFEAELLVPGASSKDSDDSNDPDYDTDERVDDSNVQDLIDDLHRFFGPSTTRSSVSRAVNTILQNHFEAYSEDFDFSNYDIEYMVRDEMPDGSSTPDQAVEEEIDNQGRYYDRARDRAYDLYLEDYNSDYDLGDILRDQDMRRMYDWHREFDWEWPHYGSSDLDLPSWLDLAQQAADSWKTAIGQPVKAYQGYHTGKRDPGVWIMEPDSSIDAGDDFTGIELISPPMPLDTGLNALEDFFKWAKAYGCSSNRSTGFHMGVSIEGRLTNELDTLKLVLFLGDEYVLKQFGRQANNYAESSLRKMRSSLSRGYIDRDIVQAALAAIKTGLIAEAKKLLESNLMPHYGKHVSVHVREKYIEFRSAGGDYMDRETDIRNTMLRYVRAYAIAADPAAETREYSTKLYKLIAENTANKKDASALALFMQYGAGTITKNTLISKLKLARELRQSTDFELRSKLDGETRETILARNMEQAREKTQNSYGMGWEATMYLAPAGANPEPPSTWKRFNLVNSAGQIQQWVMARDAAEARQIADSARPGDTNNIVGPLQ